MLVRIGLFVVALLLVFLVVFGVGTGVGLIQISSSGIAFGRAREPEKVADDQLTTVTPDELLKRAQVTYTAPTAPEAAPAASVAKAPAVATASPARPAADPAPARDSRSASRQERPRDERPQRVDDSRVLTADPTLARARLSPDAGNARDGAIRVDAGSPTPINDPRGHIWDADAGFIGGQTVDRGGIAIANTDTPDLYRTERYGMSAWEKQVRNGKYAVNLHFAETWEMINHPGQRVFHMIVQGQPVRDVDVCKEAGGPRRALVKSFHVVVTDGRLSIQFQPGSVNVPEINGIEVLAEQ